MSEGIIKSELAHHLLAGFAIADVPGYAEHRDGVAILVGMQRGHHFCVDEAPILVRLIHQGDSLGIDVIPRRPGCQRLLHLAGDAVGRFSRHQLLARLGQHLLDGETTQVLYRRAQVGEATTLDIHGPDDVGTVLRDEAEVALVVGYLLA